MSIVDNVKKKHNHKKCSSMWKVVEQKLKDSTSHTAFVYIGKPDGYEELFQRILDKGWSYELLGSKKEGFHLSVKSK